MSVTSALNGCSSDWETTSAYICMTPFLNLVYSDKRTISCCVEITNTSKHFMRKDDEH